ncbi:hypothetical protein ACJIZ3_004091 [Penstemon smallii]|uniref:Uncharacterized protein n=1 Tax=Penstemon smallii TaxID=265156 RepID=A0ABD3S195_9LAMI
MSTSIRFSFGTTTNITIPKFTKPRYQTTKIRCIGWDPEGVLGPPQAGHISRLQFKKRLEKDSDARDAFQRQVQEERQRREAFRQSRVIPDTTEGLVEFLLDTEAQEIEFEIARLRPRLNEEFFSHLKLELGKLRFAVSKTQLLDMVELNELNRSLLTLLDENISSAYQSNQTAAAEYMEKLRGIMLKYITV